MLFRSSRSEFRLLLRQDNADLRLTPEGYRVGLITEARYQKFLAKKQAQEQEAARLEKTHLPPAAVNPLLESLGMPPVTTGISLAELLRRPTITYALLAPLDPNRPALTRREAEAVEVSVKYEGYIRRQLAEVERTAKLESRRLPDDIDYSTIRGLRIEAIQKLTRIRPATLGQASRISGVSPADISVLLVWMGVR